MILKGFIVMFIPNFSLKPYMKSLCVCRQQHEVHPFFDLVMQVML